MPALLFFRRKRKRRRTLARAGQRAEPLCLPVADYDAIGFQTRRFATMPGLSPRTEIHTSTGARWAPVGDQRTVAEITRSSTFAEARSPRKRSRDPVGRALQREHELERAQSWGS